MNVTSEELSLVNAPAFEGRESIVIGCGGIGTSAVDYLKGILSQYFDLDTFNGVRLLSVDTAQQDRGTRKVYLTDEEIVRVFSQNLRKLVRQINVLEHIDEWFETCPLTDTILNEIPSSMDGAATTRPFGRLSLFERADGLIGRLQTLVNQDVTIHSKTKFGQEATINTDRKDIYIISSLGGGTGSGIFLDIAALMRKLQLEQHQQWYITGIFVLPEILHRDHRIPRQFRPKILANGYAALKELDHFLHGNRFTARYGRDRTAQVTLEQESHEERLFNMVFLLDCPNLQHRELIKDRDSISEMIARAVFYLSLTEAGKYFYTRYPDIRGNLSFAEERPSTLGRRIREKRQTLYATFGLATLEIPVEKMVKFCAVQMALEIHANLVREGVLGEDRTQLIQDRLHDLLKIVRLDGQGLQELFDPESLFPPTPSPEQIIEGSWLSSHRRQAFENLQEAFQRFTLEGELEDLRETIMSQVRAELNRICGHGAVPGELAEALDRIVETEGHFVADEVCEDLREEIEARISDTKKSLREAEALRDNPEQDIRMEIEDALVDQIRNPCNRNMLRSLVDSILARIRLYRDVNYNPVLLECQLEYLEKFRDEIQRREDNIDELGQAVRQVREELKNFQRNIDFASKPFHRLVFDASTAKNFYRTYFLPRLARNQQPLSLAEKIKKDGLTLENGITIKLDNWEDHPPGVIAKALLSRVQPILYLSSGESSIYNLDTENGAKALWRLDFKSPYFRDVGHEADDFNRFQSELLHYGAESLFYDQSDMINQRLRLVFSGSRYQGERSWQTILGKSDLHLFPSRQPNQVTLFSFRMGFALYSLGFIKEWERQYQIESWNGTPLHLFKQAHDKFKDPYFPMEFDRADSGTMFEWLLKYNVIQKIGDEDNYFFNSEFAKGKEVFLESKEEPRNYTRKSLIDSLFSDKAFQEAFQDVLIAHATSITDPNIQEKLQEGKSLSSSEMVECAIGLGLIQEKNGNLSFSSPPPSIKSHFTSHYKIRKKVTRDMFEKALEMNDIFYLELLDELVDQIIVREKQDDPNEFYRKYAEKEFPEFILNELTDFFQGVF